MEAMDEMFIPYKDMFEPPTRSIHVHDPTPKSSWKLDWKLVLVVLIVIGIGFGIRVLFSTPEPRKPATRAQVHPTAQVQTAQVVPQVPTQVPAVPKVSLPIALQPVKQSVAPLVSAVPTVIEFKNPQELARGVGTELRDVLLKHKQIPSLAVAGIVSNAVRTLLGEDERPEEPKSEVLQPKEELKEDPKREEPKEEPKREEPKREEPKRKEPKLDDLDDEPEPPKRGKINADTDPSLLKLLKERGLTN